MKRYVQLSIVPALLASPLPLLAGGSLDPATAPGSTSSYTLENIYNRLNDGTAGSQSTFAEPGSGPAVIGYTLNEVMAKAPAEDNTNGALVSEILSGKTFFGLRTDGTWGLQTGTLATQSPTDTTVNQAAGNYSAFILSTVDTDLVAENIKKDVDIFGVTGTYESAAVAKTGQTTCYDVAGNPIACAGTGQDGEKLVGATWPNPRFANNGDGTVTDKLTGLIWLQNANCAETELDWVTAFTYVAELNTSGTMDGNNCGDTSNSGSFQTDWRLPNSKELFSLVNAEYEAPALSNAAGTGQWAEDDAFSADIEDGEYWSSTTAAGEPDRAWGVSFSEGFLSYLVKTNDTDRFAWAVRGGQ